MTVPQWWYGLPRVGVFHGYGYYYRPGTPSSVRFITPSTLYLVDGTGAPPVTEPSKMPVGDNYCYRPGTPGSVSVCSTISKSSTQGLTNPRYDYMHPRWRQLPLLWLLTASTINNIRNGCLITNVHRRSDQMAHCTSPVTGKQW